MFSRDLNVHDADPGTLRWDDPDGPILVDIRRTHGMRDVRNALLELAFRLQAESPLARAACVIIDSKLSPSRLDEELRRLRAVLRPELAGRIHVLVGRSRPDSGRPDLGGSMDNVAEPFRAWLAERLGMNHSHGRAARLPPRRVVVAALAQRRLGNQPAVAIRHLQDSCGVSYPTVAATLRELADKGWLEERGERGVRLRPLTASEWMELARDHAAARKTHLFIDPTGQAVPEQLARRVERLREAGTLAHGVRIGGVLGASRHFPALDISAAPRLDLSVDTDPARVAELIDAGLRPRTRPEQRVVLAVHLTRDATSLDTAGMTARRGGAGDPWAGQLECLADLVELGFAREASGMALHMEQIGKEGTPAA